MNLEETLKKCFIFLFIIFITIYIFYSSGYSDYKLHKRVELTNEQIEKFENDIKNNNYIDVNNYVENTKQDYSNKFSKIALSFSNFTSKYVKEGIKGVFDIISDFMS